MLKLRMAGFDRIGLLALALAAAACGSTENPATPPGTLTGVNAQTPGGPSTTSITMGNAMTPPPMAPSNANAGTGASTGPTNVPGLAGGAGMSAGPSSMPMGPIAGTGGVAATGTDSAAPPIQYMDGPLEGKCPDGFTPSDGMNMGFMTSDNAARQFYVHLPTTDMDTPRPVFLAITGTVEMEEMFAVNDARIVQNLTAKGWIILVPVRNCSTSGRSCYSEGDDGWIWYPWNDGSQDDKWNKDMGPDPRFMEEMTRCAATKWKIDQRRIFIGGISAGGAFSYRNLTYNSKFFAGGVPASGMWYTVSDSGPLVPSGGQMKVMADPEAIYDGYCCPRPIAENKLEPMIIIDTWGGDGDRWTRPGQSALTFDYRHETQAASNYFATQTNVVHLACSGTQAHNWPGVSGNGSPSGAAADNFNNWMADLLYSHPKGSDPSTFKMVAPPQGYNCTLGRFTDHY